ncbi:MAG: hypothetical protein CMJ32_10720 [Phycisphaerae bacterium]|nr:hypothetical protein [Phycisphaerae bacterium]
MIRQSWIHRRLTRAVLVSMATLTAVCLSGNSHAQFGGQAGFADAFQPTFLRRDAQLINDVLKLEQWQRHILESLLEDYSVSFKMETETARLKMKDQTEAMRQMVASGQANNPEMMRLIMAPLEQLNQTKELLRIEFLDNLKSQLGPVQLEQWPRLEMALTREYELPKGEISGESTNLVTLINEMNLPSEAMMEAEPAIIQYEIDLDGALQSRMSTILQNQDMIKEAMATMDFDSGLIAMEKLMQQRVAVRTANDQAIESISESLPAPHGDAFRMKAHERGYPKAFLRSPILRYFELARSLETLTDEQLIAIDTLEVDYLSELGQLQMHMVAVLREDEPKKPRQEVQLMIDRRNGDQTTRRSESQAWMDAKKMRDELNNRTLQALRDILTPEQNELLPSFGNTKGGNAQGRIGGSVPSSNPDGVRAPSRPSSGSPDRRLSPSGPGSTDRPTRPPRHSGHSKKGAPQKGGSGKGADQ